MCEAHKDDALFDVTKEPPLRKETHDGESEGELATTDHSKSKEGGTAHNLRIIEVADEWCDREAHGLLIGVEGTYR